MTRHSKKLFTKQVTKAVKFFFSHNGGWLNQITDEIKNADNIKLSKKLYDNKERLRDGVWKPCTTHQSL